MLVSYNKTIVGKRICYDKCEKWHDIKCAKLDDWNFRLYELDETLNWTCPTCIASYCSKCDLPFKKSQNSVCCDCCNKWLHLKCSGLTVYQLESIKNDTWFCKSCYNDIFPFHNIDNNKL